jgi:hypothetical protein
MKLSGVLLLYKLMKFPLSVTVSLLVSSFCFPLVSFRTYTDSYSLSFVLILEGDGGLKPVLSGLSPNFLKIGFALLMVENLVSTFSGLGFMSNYFI